jgi:hypothetical protein
MTDDRLRRSAVTWALWAAVLCAAALIGTTCALLLLGRSVPPELYQLTSTIVGGGLTVTGILKFTERHA